MSRSRREGLAVELRRGRDRFRAWRRTRKLGTRIPQPLWDLAVKLAKRHGVSRTAAVLRLDYYALKRRLESAGSESQSPSSAFVEVFGPPGAGMGECVVELEDGLGSRMRVHLKGYDAPDLLALGRSFWDGE